MSKTATPDTVLVIDDNADFCELVNVIGQVAGVPVLTAPNCRTGLKVLSEQKGKIKLILLDYFMPGMTAAACVRAISSKVGLSVPVVLLTATMDAGALAAELGLSRWLAKPIHPSTLMEIMSETYPIRDAA